MKMLEAESWKRDVQKRVLWIGFVLLCFTAGCAKVVGIPSSPQTMGETLTTEQRFTLKNVDGTVMELSQVLSQKKLVLLNFWATWCGYCVEEMPDLIKLQEKHASSGFTVIGINAGETQSQAADFVKKHGVNFPVVLDEDTAVSQAYGLVGIPVSILVDSTGKVIGEYHGFTPKMIADIESNLKQ